MLAFKLPSSNGNPNDFTGSTAAMYLKHESGNRMARGMVWNYTTSQFEYVVTAGEFAAGRWRLRIAVTFPDSAIIYSNESVFDVVAAD